MTLKKLDLDCLKAKQKNPKSNKINTLKIIPHQYLLMNNSLKEKYKQNYYFQDVLVRKFDKTGLVDEKDFFKYTTEDPMYKNKLVKVNKQVEFAKIH